MVRRVIAFTEVVQTSTRPGFAYPRCPPQPEGVSVEVDLDLRGLEPRGLEPANRPPAQVDLLGSGAVDPNLWTDLDRRSLCLGKAQVPGGDAGRQAEDRGSEAGDRAHASTFDPAS